ncbi:hypothetical protein SBRCBS47491_008284 [Sporothrix bragantina]|uniref:Siderophore esterase n=1 Tax=Sporothrix bragantina TaxID=671064 RepID=A0ABP0CN12_9PEZI
MANPTTPVSLLNTAQRVIDTQCGQLQLMVSWPLGWSEDGQPPAGEQVSDIPVVFVLDGNAYFATATDIVRRLQFVVRKKAIAVGVGYPFISDAVFAMERRALDLTPPSKKGDNPTWKPRPGQGATQPPGGIGAAQGAHGTPNAHGLPGGRPQLKYGGAASFQRALADELLPAVPEMLPALAPVWTDMRKVLFGHSFGGLFTLYSLFSQPGVFDTYVSASPSLWFNDSAIQEHEEAFLRKGKKETGISVQKPKLYITGGTAEEDLLQKPGDGDEFFARRQADVKAKQMNKKSRDLAERLRDSGLLSEVWLQIFDLEDHGSSAVCGLQRSINKVLDEWWVGR